jgi:hypothetical protein
MPRKVLGVEMEWFRAAKVKVKIRKTILKIVKRTTQLLTVTDILLLCEMNFSDGFVCAIKRWLFV